MSDLFDKFTNLVSIVQEVEIFEVSASCEGSPRCCISYRLCKINCIMRSMKIRRQKLSGIVWIMKSHL